MPGGVYLLPEQADTLESFQWLAQEVKHAQGEALVARVAAFEGFSEGGIVSQFNSARRPEYEELAGQVDNLLG